MKNKIAIIINGQGGVGKDTLCDIAATRYRVRNRSSITPIKEIARQYGWNGEKTLPARRFLAELKQAFTNYLDLPNEYLRSEYRTFLETEEQILFMHVRECDQIAALRESLGGDCVTLLVRRSTLRNNTPYGNASDDEVENYNYDYIYDNSAPLEETGPLFLAFLGRILADRNVNLEEKSDGIV